MSLSGYVEAGPWFGEYKLVGDKYNTSSAFTIPIKIRFNENFSLEFLSARTRINGNGIADYDLGILIGKRYISGKIGFRRIESPNDYLQGPYLRISLYY